MLDYYNALVVESSCKNQFFLQVEKLQYTFFRTVYKLFDFLYNALYFLPHERKVSKVQIDYFKNLGQK